MKKRMSGILLHISSLPGPYGIGDFGPEAYKFVDFLRETKQSYWQLLPLNPTEPIYGNSPYSSPSAFAINPLFLNPELLVEEGWLRKGDLDPVSVFPTDRCDYEAAAEYKKKLVNTAFEHFTKSRKETEDFERFVAQHKMWLADYALFTILKKNLRGRNFSDWPKELRDREPQALKNASQKFTQELKREKFVQYLLFGQWQRLRAYCENKKISLIGDIPIYVNDDSADVWANPQLFKLGEDKKPLFVAGVPPDYFSETGQRWGNPVYEWEVLYKTGYAWWVNRIRHNLDLFHLIRIDHFRGFEAYWEIPASEETAVQGQWVTVPSIEFFNKLKKEFPQLPFIAEDLGIITPEVTALMERYGFTGMKVLLFAFGGEMETHPYNPKNYVKNCVVYTGTHDNNTIKGWFEKDASEEEKQNLVQYYFKREISVDELPWALIRLGMESSADTIVIPLQDVLGLGAEARMNKPATVNGNWLWRVYPPSIPQEVKDALKKLTIATKRASFV